MPGFGIERQLDHFDFLIADNRTHNLTVNRMHGFRNQDTARCFMRTHRHQSRFRQRRSAVVHTGIGDIHAGQRSHHRLIFIQQLQCALAGFRLIRRIRRIKFAARGDLPYSSRNVMLIRTRADVILVKTILVRAFHHQTRDLQFAEPGRNTGELAADEFIGNFVKQIFN